ncbi:MAG: hypothetical protein IJO31_00485 [Oscillospiraceae bacterium]|nr:hypothetical protein [Oscillospiraceae bacterium]
MKKGIIAVIVAIVLLLSGCQNNTPSVTSPTDADDPIQFAPEKNAQNKYLMGYTNFQEADGFFLGTAEVNGYLLYYDKASGISGVLCADPSCAHDSRECGGNLGGKLSLSYYDGKVYWVGPEGTQLQKYYLWQSDLSGMNRKKIMEIPWDEIIMPYQPQRYVIHQGKLYIMGSASVVDGTQTGKRKSLLSIPLTGDEGFTTVYDEVWPNANDNERYIFIDGFIYIYMSSFNEESSTQNLTVTKVDIAKNTSEVVYQENDVTDILGNIWVTDNHEIYLTGSTDKEAYLWKLENGVKTEITSWSGERVSTPDVMDEIVLCLSYDNDIRWADIRDLTGKTIYSGKLFPDVIPELEHDPNDIPSVVGWGNTYSTGLIGGDAGKLIYHLSGEEGSKQNRKFVDYTILLDLTDNMKATILWSSRE